MFLRKMGRDHQRSIVVPIPSQPIMVETLFLSGVTLTASGINSDDTVPLGVSFERTKNCFLDHSLRTCLLAGIDSCDTVPLGVSFERNMDIFS